MALTNLNAAVAWTQQSVNTAQNGRYHIGALFPAAAATTGMTAWRDGVITTTNTGGSNNIPNDLQIKALGSPSLSLTVEAGHCIITRSGQGPFLGYNVAQGTITLANADTVNPRIDRIVAQIYDTTIGDSLAGLSPAPASPGCLVIRAISGNPNGTPAAPATPTGAISLATVFVAANDTTITGGDITDTRRSAFSPEGARPLLPGDLIADAGAVAGGLRYSTDVAQGGVSVWTGTAWQRLTPLVLPQPTQAGFGLLTTGSSTSIAQVAIPDIGGSYWIEASASVEFTFTSGTQTGTLGIEVRIDSSTWSDTVFHTKGIGRATSLPSGFDDQASCLPSTGPAGTAFTGTHTAYLNIKNLTGPDMTIVQNNSYTFNVKLIPKF